MTRSEVRKLVKEREFTAGDVQYEISEINKLQHKCKVDALETITVSCTEILTIICC